MRIFRDFSHELVQKLLKKIDIHETKISKLEKSFSEWGDSVSGTVTRVSNLESSLGELAQSAGVTGDRVSNLEVSLGELAARVHDKKYIFIGDSYGVGYTPEAFVDGWVNHCVSALHLSQDDYINKSHGGYGFVAQEGTFESLLTDAYNQAKGNNTTSQYTDIVVCGGFNDATAITLGITSKDHMKNAIETFCIKARTYFPNATVRLGFIGWSTDGHNIDVLSSAYESYMTACASNLSILENVQYVMHDTTMFCDGVHPNENGYRILGKAIAKSLSGGLQWCIHKRTCSLSTHAEMGNMEISNKNGCYMNINNDTAEVVLLSNSFTWPDGTNLALNGSYINLANLTGNLFTGNPDYSISVPLHGATIVTDTDGYKLVNGNLYISSNRISATLYVLNDEGSGYYTGKVNALYIPFCRGTFSTMSC